jgi:hypothetical protein
MATTILATAAKTSAMIITFAHLMWIASALSTDASALESAISALVSEITTLESGSEFWEKSLPWFTGLVVLGLVADVVVIIWERRDEIAAYRRWIHQGFHPAERPSRRKFALELVASAAILLGVAGELWAEAAIASINGQLRSKNAELRTSRTSSLRSCEKRLKMNRRPVSNYKKTLSRVGSEQIIARNLLQDSSNLQEWMHSSSMGTVTLRQMLSAMILPWRYQLHTGIPLTLLMY